MQVRSWFKQAISTKPDIGGKLGSVGPTPPRGRDKSGPYALNIASLVVFGNSPPITNRSENPNLFVSDVHFAMMLVIRYTEERSCCWLFLCETARRHKRILYDEC